MQSGAMFLSSLVHGMCKPFAMFFREKRSLETYVNIPGFA